MNPRHTEKAKTTRQIRDTKKNLRLLEESETNRWICIAYLSITHTLENRVTQRINNAQKNGRHTKETKDVAQKEQGGENDQKRQGAYHIVPLINEKLYELTKGNAD